MLSPLLPIALAASFQLPPRVPTRPPPELVPTVLVCDAATRIADPKLDGGAPSLAFHVEPAGLVANVQVDVLQGGVLVGTAWSGAVVGGASTTTCTWSGRDLLGARCNTGAYTWRVSASGASSVELPLDLVRLGVTEVEAQSSPGTTNEFQMVYFRRGTGYTFTATPATHEYINSQRATDVSELDRNDGEPRPVVAVHSNTAEPVMNGVAVETLTHNYPLAYVQGAAPRLHLMFGGTGTAADGSAMDVGFPVAGEELRVVSDDAVAAGTDVVLPWGTVDLDLPPLPAEVGRTDRVLHLRFEHRATGTNEWRSVPGEIALPLRYYTLLGTPRFKAGATGLQYTGPWVEVAEYVSSWKATLGLPATTQAELTTLFVHGFFGQNGGLPAAIEGVRYDAGPLGGDGGATHYYASSSNNMQLSRLLHAHANGVFVNCSDNMGAATTMLSMLGATNVRPVFLGGMSLRAIWGIGAPGYTLNLWGSGPHSFTYHHILTDDDGVTVSDTCMQLDEDGAPSALPGTPGWNARRPWTGANGYMALAATNVVTTSLQTLPGLQ